MNLEEIFVMGGKFVISNIDTFLPMPKARKTLEDAFADVNFCCYLCQNKQGFEPYLIQLSPHRTQMYKHKGKSGLSEKSELHGAKILKTLQDHAYNTQKEIIDFLIRERSLGNVDYISPYYISNTISVTCTKEVITQVSKKQLVEEIIPNNRYKIKHLNDDKDFRTLESEIEWSGNISHWSLAFINSTGLDESVYKNAAKLIYANAGKLYLTIDTGVDYKHPALYSNYMGLKANGSVVHDHSWWDANKLARYRDVNTACGINSKYPCADHSHGTHTMSTTVGSMGLGVSSSTRWIACKNMDDGYGSPESYLGCLQFFLAPTDLDGNNPRPDLRPHVVGNSYGCPSEEGCTISSFKYAMEAIKNAGILMVVSAGNEGRTGCSSILSPPAVDPSSFTVAASQYLSFQRASFSSLGPSIYRDTPVDITAPGVNITGAIPGGKYASMQGTSMASPHVSGAALLIIAACPHLSRQVDLIADILRSSSTPIYPTKFCGDDNKNSVPNNVTRLNIGIRIWND